MRTPAAAAGGECGATYRLATVVMCKICAHLNYGNRTVLNITLE
jgi:hypothetical protein